MKSSMIIDCGGRLLNLTHPAVMGILNITPDSFSDGGIYLCRDEAVVHASNMVDQGAAVIDIGGESTRPGAQAVSAAEEIDRVVPIIEILARSIRVPISIDTSKPEVMRAAIAAGASIINDVRALRLPGAIEAAASLKCPVVLMHMQGDPATMQQQPQYQDVVADVRGFLEERIAACVAAGMAREKILIDPGFGFGKTVEHNLRLLRRLRDLDSLGPLVVGLSRKSMIGKLLGLPVEQRLHASVALAVIAVQNGARLVRAHDVAPTVEALQIWEAVNVRK